MTDKQESVKASGVAGGMTTYLGRCRGGPYDGKDLAHWSTRREVMVLEGAQITQAYYQHSAHGEDVTEGIWIWRGPETNVERA